MARPRKYSSDADKQKAYRERSKRNSVPLRNVTVARPALRWLGGKWRLADWIASHFPPHRCYCEPFGGGGNILLQKPPSQIEVYNDLDSDVVNFFSVLRSQPQELIRLIELTPFSRQELAEAVQPTNDALERARRLYVRSWQSFQPGSGYDRSPSWRFQKDWARGKALINEWNTVDHLEAVAARLKMVQIENRPAADVIRRFDEPTTLFYADPPYVHSTRTLESETRYKYEMTDEQHIQLADQLHHVKGMVIVSGYDSPLYDELYSGWGKTIKSTTTNGNGTATEYLWLSPSAVDEKRWPLFAKAAL